MDYNITIDLGNGESMTVSEKKAESMLHQLFNKGREVREARAAADFADKNKEGETVYRPFQWEWKPPTMKVLEVTGMKNGLHVSPKWFKTTSEALAEAYLKSLDWGNMWVSDAWVTWKGYLNTGKRKRVRTLVCKCGQSLKTPHAYCAIDKQVSHIKPFITV